MQILIAVIIFLEILSYLVIIDVVLSWLPLLWIKFRPKFIADIMDPLYTGIKKIIPTTFWPFDFTPLLILFLLFFIESTLYIIFPDLTTEVNNLMY